METRKMVLKNAMVLAEDKLFENGYVEIAGEVISNVGAVDEYTNSKDAIEYQFPDNYIIVPGFIDLHIHGTSGADVMDGSIESLEIIARALPEEGTTSFLATTMTSRRELIERALATIAKFRGNKRLGCAQLLGVHLEGPFLSHKRAGAQPIEHILQPSIEVFQRWQRIAGGTIRLVTLAPEMKNALQLIRYLRDAGVIVSIGHSNATYEDAVKAINYGINHCTHLFNGMNGLHHREPGIVGAVFLEEDVRCEIIADGIHVRPEVIKLAYKIKGRNGIILITDGIRAKCLGPGIYELAGQKVNVDHEKAVLQDGTLAGSVLRMIDAVRNMMKFTNCQFTEAVQMATVNAAKQLGIFHRKGSIAVGKDADIVVLNHRLEVAMTICRGHVAYVDM